MSKYDGNMKEPKCSFCGKTSDQVRRLVAGPGVFICNECIDLCCDILDEDDYPGAGEAAPQEQKLLYPAEIKAKLDEYIIGQEMAKKPCPSPFTTTIRGSIPTSPPMWSCKRATS